PRALRRHRHRLMPDSPPTPARNGADMEDAERRLAMSTRNPPGSRPSAGPRDDATRNPSECQYSRAVEPVNARSGKKFQILGTNSVFTGFPPTPMPGTPHFPHTVGKPRPYKRGLVRVPGAVRKASSMPRCARKGGDERSKLQNRATRGRSEPRLTDRCWGKGRDEGTEASGTSGC